MKQSIVREITLDGRKIKYNLEYKNVKNINIRITPEKGFCVSAPFNADIILLESYLKSTSSKILDAIDKCELINKGTDPKTIERPGTNKRTIELNGKTVEYKLQFKKIKRINLSVNIERGIHVSAPYGTSVSVIEEFIKNNSDFIFNALEKYKKLKENMPKPKKYENGEYIYFLGEIKTLLLKKSTRNFIKIQGNEIHLFVTDTNNFELKEYVIDEFIKEECNRYILNLCNKIYPRFKKKNIDFPKEIRFRKMTSCWGNCRPERGILTFNTHLIQLPPKCIEVVVCHEFTHFLHNNHSKDFYSQLTEFMPDWKTHDKILKELQQEIIIKKS